MIEIGLKFSLKNIIWPTNVAPSSKVESEVLHFADCVSLYIVMFMYMYIIYASPSSPQSEKLVLYI
jgi:hypothetical protein